MSGISDDLLKSHRKAHKNKLNQKWNEPIQTELEDFKAHNNLTLNHFITLEKTLKGD